MNKFVVVALLKKFMITSSKMKYVKVTKKEIVERVITRYVGRFYPST